MLTRSREKQPNPHHRVGIKKSCIKKFQFTNSSKVLPKQHTSQQFAQIIDNKKIYQSMIKDELRKLQTLQTCVPDPEIEQFVIPEDIEENVKIKQINNNKEKVQGNRSYGKSKRVRVDEKELDIDLYLQKEPDGKQIQKMLRYREKKLFYKSISRYNKQNRNKKAGSYFHYHNTIAKCFKELKSLTSEDIQSNQINTQIIQQVKKCNLRNYLKVFVAGVKGQILKNDIKVLEKVREVNSKRYNLRSLHISFKKHKEIQDKMKQFVRFHKKIAINTIMNRIAGIKSVDQGTYNVILMRKRIQLQHIIHYIKQKHNASNQRIYGKVWSIVKEIDEEVQAESDTNINEKMKQVQSAIYRNRVTIWLSNLKENVQNNKSYQVLIQKLQQNKHRKLLSKLAHNKNLRNKQSIVLQQSKQLSSLFLRTKLNNFKSQIMKQQIKAQKLKDLQEKISKYESMSNNSSIDRQQVYYQIGIALIHNRMRHKFIALLQLHRDINKKSTIITQKYIRNMFAHMHKNKNHCKQIQQAVQKMDILKNYIQTNGKCGFLHQYRILVQNKIALGQKIEELVQHFKASKLKLLINSIKERSTLKKLRYIVQQKRKQTIYLKFINKLQLKLKITKQKKKKNISQNNSKKQQVKKQVQNGQHQQKIQKNQSQIEKESPRSNILQSYLNFSQNKSQKQSKIHQYSQYEYSPLFKRIKQQIYEESSEKKMIENGQNENVYQHFLHISQHPSEGLNFCEPHHSDSAIGLLQDRIAQQQYEISNKMYHKNLAKEEQKSIEYLLNQKLPQNQDQIESSSPQHIQQIQILPGSQSYHEQIAQQMNQSANDMMLLQYAIGFANTKLVKKCFRPWKNITKYLREQSIRERKQSYELMKKSFEGLRMISRQKILAKKYLKQYEEQIHYYPHSIQQYHQFKQIAGQI